MSVSQIPNLTPATSLNGSEQLEAVQAGSSVRLTTAQIGTYVASTYPAPGISSVTANSPLSSSTTSGAVTIYLPTAAITNTYLGQMAAGTVKANLTGGTASPSDVLPSAILDTFSSTPGAVLYRGASAWQTLGIGTNTQILTSNGTTPYWTTLSVPSGNIAPTGVTAGTYGTASSVPQFTVLASGQISAAANVPIAINVSQVSGLAPSATTDTTNATNITSGVLAAARYSATLSAALDASAGATQGSILYRNATGWTQLGPGISGQVLSTNGTGANPSWLSAAGAGTVTSVTTGTGLTGGPITASGTISIANTAVAAGSYGTSSAVGSFTVNAQGQLTSAGNTTINAVTLTTGSITTAPSNANDLVNKSYVDAAISNVNYHAACNFATTADLGAVTYNNGASGVGATITKTTPFATLAIDGGSPTVNQRILVKNESNGAYNGIYTVTSVGSGSVGWVLTRATDYDQVGTGTSEIAPGDTTYIISGTQNAGTQWVQTTDLPITIGTTAIVFAQIAGPGAYTAGTGLTLTGTQFSIANTTVTANSYGSASSVGSFTVNAQGQLTAASSTPIAIAASQITSGTLPVAQGGTGIASYTIGDLIYASGTTTLSTLADVATGNALLSGGVGGAPSWGKVNLTSAISGTLPVANGGTGQSIALTQYGVIYGASTTAMGVTAAGATGQVLVGNTSAAPSWSTLSSLAVSSISFGSTGLTPSTATTGAVTVAGTLAVANGGTGLTSTPANGALDIGNGTNFTRTTLTAGTAISVTNGAGSITIANTGVTSAVAGTGISVSASTGAVTITNSGVASISFGTTGLTPSTATTGVVTVAGTLAVANGGTGVTTSTGTGSVVLSTSPTLVTPVLGTPTSVTLTNGTGLPLTTGVTGTLPVANGGTGVTTSTGTGSVVLSASPTLTGTLTVPTITSAASTALTIQSAGTTAMTVDTSQNVGIGTTSPAAKLDVNGTILAGKSGTSVGYIGLLGGTSNNTGYAAFYNAAGTRQAYIGYIGPPNNALNIETDSGSNVPIRFATNAAEAARIDTSGNLLVGTTSISNARLVVYGNSTTAQTVYASSSNAIGISNTSGTATYNGLDFSNNGGSSFVASVQVFASSVAYNTSSDARLKDNVQDAELALGLVNQIKVRQFDWKNTGEHQRYGMVAQELQNIAPEFVNDQLDKDHTLGIDYSKMAPMLIKAIQELSAKNDALEARLAKLETV